MQMEQQVGTQVRERQGVAEPTIGRILPDRVGMGMGPQDLCCLFLGIVCSFLHGTFWSYILLAPGLILEHVFQCVNMPPVLVSPGFTV